MLKNKKARNWIAGGLGFFLAIALFITICSVEILLGLCSNVTLRRSVRDSDYAERAYEEFTEEATELLRTNSITIQGEMIFSEKDILFAFSNFEEAVYKHKEPKSNVENIAGSVEVAIWEYLASNGIEVTETMEAGIKRNSKAISEMYQQYLEPEFLKNIHDYAYSGRERLKLCMIIGGIASIGIIILMLLLFRHKHKALRYVIASFLAAAIWNVALTVLAAVQLNVDKIGISSSAYIHFLNAYEVSIRVPFLIMSAVMVLAVGMLFYLLKYLRRQG